MIRSPAGFDGEIRIKRYMDYYQASYGVMMLSSGQFGAGTAAGYLLGSEPSGYATDFTAGGVQGNALVRSSPRNTQMDYSGTPFLAQGGPVTFSRGSLATVTDSDGYIKWAQHNLLLASEQLDTSSWTKTSATIAANSIAAPDSAITADTIVASGANGTVLQSYTAVAVSYVFGVWLRRKTGAGNIQIAADNGTYTTVTITNDWALYTVTQTPTAGTKSAGIRIVTSGDEVYAWGAYLYRSDLGGMQANASAYPYYNPSTPKNLLGYSEAFDNAAWVKLRINAFGSGSVANATIAPNGSLSADLITENTTASDSHTLYQGTSSLPSGGKFVYSFYAKPNGRNWVQAVNYIDRDYSCFFDIQNGTVGSAVNATGSITSVGDGWYRCSIAFTVAVAGASECYVFLATANNTRSYTGDGTSGIYLWGAQLSDSASLDPYVGSYGAAPSPAAAYGPRLDYDPSTLAAKGLLVEEQRTNLITQSADFSASSVWGVGGITVSANVISAPDGTTSADKLIEDTSTGFHRISQSVSITSGTTYTFSVYVKSAERTIINIQLGGGPFTFTLLQYNLSAGTSTGGTITPVGGGWYRCTASSLATSTSSGTVFVEVCDSSGQRNYTGNGFSGVYVWGAQLEAGSFATSYIPTAAATVTRNADVASVGVSQFPYSATEGSIVANVTPLNVAAARRAVQIDDNTENERYTLSTNSTPNGLFTVIDGGSSQAAIATGTPAANTNIKLAARYKVNDFALSVNGGAASTDTSGTLPIANLLMRLGSGTSSTEPLNGHIRQITYIPRALANAELTARSA